MAEAGHRLVCRGEVSDYVLMEGRGFGFVTYGDPQNAQQFLEVSRPGFAPTSNNLGLVSASGRPQVSALTLLLVTTATRARNRRQESGGQGRGTQELRQQPRADAEDVCRRHGAGRVGLALQAAAV